MCLFVSHIFSFPPDCMCCHINRMNRPASIFRSMIAKQEVKSGSEPINMCCDLLIQLTIQKKRHSIAWATSVNIIWMNILHYHGNNRVTIPGMSLQPWVYQSYCQCSRFQAHSIYCLLQQLSCFSKGQQSFISLLRVYFIVETDSTARMSGRTVFSQLFVPKYTHLIFYYFLHCRIIVKTSKLWNNTYGIM